MEDLKIILKEAASRFEVPGFVDDDPVQFPRLFTETADIEIVSLLVSAISWGNRKMILRDARRLVDAMGTSPLEWVLSGRWESMPDDMNIHRTLFALQLKRVLRALASIYGEYPTLERFAEAKGIFESEYPAWRLAECLNEEISACNSGLLAPAFLPVNVGNSALKRLNMALRWLVRKDSSVDLGVWSGISPGKLFMPLDVHVVRVARGLGLLNRKSVDFKAAVELTHRLREFDFDDPVRFDFALFSIGESGDFAAGKL